MKGRRIESPTTALILVLFVVCVLCAGIGYNIYNQRSVIVDDSGDDSNQNVLGNDTNIVPIDFAYKSNFYGCYNSECVKMDLDKSNYNLENTKEDSFDDSLTGTSLKTTIDDNALIFELGDRIYKIKSFKDPQSVKIMGDKNEKIRYIYILTGDKILNKLKDSEFSKIGTNNGTINIEKMSTDNITGFYASRYTNDGSTPAVELYIASSSNKGDCVSIDGNIYIVNNLINQVRFNNDFVLLNTNYDKSEDYNYLKYNGEKITASSMFYYGEQVIVVNSNIYRITKNRISKFSEEKVKSVEKKGDEIVVTYQGTGNTDKYKFVINKVIYLDNIMYTDFTKLDED